jgi:catechol 2,3-dioxygenase-like lactoylglutathione lyase family enzyme
MAIDNILINVADVQRSVDFYSTLLQAQVIGEPTEDRADLDLITATITLLRLPAQVSSTWIPDDLQRGFRHVGFKVAEVAPFVIALDAAGVEFHLRPIDAEGDVRITFFYDPDGTLLELVEGDLQYHEVVDAAGVAKERALGVPARPRFDHIGVTVDDLQASEATYAPFGFANIGVIHQPSDPRGFEINYLKGGDTVLEIFTFDAAKSKRAPQLDALGFVSIRLDSAGDGSPADIASVAEVVGVASDGREVFADTDGLGISVSEGKSLQ